MVVSDGSKGFEAALSHMWPNCPHQRCLVHVVRNIQTCLTSRPKTQAGRELLELAKVLPKLTEGSQQDLWIEHFLQWVDMWNDFLNTKIEVDGKPQYSFKRLRQARNLLLRLIREETLFTFLRKDLSYLGKLPSSTNTIEGGTNSPLKEVLRRHRGQNKDHIIKCAGWWCLMHTENPGTPAQILAKATKEKELKARPSKHNETYGYFEPDMWGSGVEWKDYHSETPYPYSTDLSIIELPTLFGL